MSLIVGGIESSVDVSVDIAADGTHINKIIRSSGSSQVDDLVLTALKQWKWDPAARDGQPIASTQNFLFKFKPR
jgi:protein TonB